MAKVKCPICRSSSIQVLQSGVNMKQQTSINLNPLKPFTIFNHKQKKKVSVAKTTAAVLTGGLSTVVTGGIRKNQNVVFCVQCGHRWTTR